MLVYVVLVVLNDFPSMTALSACQMRVLFLLFDLAEVQANVDVMKVGQETRAIYILKVKDAIICVIQTIAAMDLMQMVVLDVFRTLRSQQRVSVLVIQDGVDLNENVILSNVTQNARYALELGPVTVSHVSSTLSETSMGNALASHNGLVPLVIYT